MSSPCSKDLKSSLASALLFAAGQRKLLPVGHVKDLRKACGEVLEIDGQKKNRRKRRLTGFEDKVAWQKGCSLVIKDPPFSVAPSFAIPFKFSREAKRKGPLHAIRDFPLPSPLETPPGFFGGPDCTSTTTSGYMYKCQDIMAQYCPMAGRQHASTSRRDRDYFPLHSVCLTGSV